MNIEEFDFTEKLQPNIRLLESAIKANYILADTGDSETIESTKESEGSKSAPQLAMVLFGYRMGYSDSEIQNKFGISNKMIAALWIRIKAALLERDKEFITKIKLCENYLRLMARK